MEKERPLQGKRVLITRAKEQVKEFVDRIESEGGVAITAPLLEIRANDTNEQMIRSTIHHLKDYHCIVFTSANGVTFFKNYLDKWQISYKNLNHLIAASVGRKTSKQMKKLGLSVSIIPEEFVAEKLTDNIIRSLKPNSRILVIRGNLARPNLVTGLRQNGFNVTDLVVYETIHKIDEAEKLKKYVQQSEIDYITFTSSSTVDSFMKVLREKELVKNLQKITFVCIGPITNETLKEYGFEGIMPNAYTIEEMVKVMTLQEEK